MYISESDKVLYTLDYEVPFHVVKKNSRVIKKGRDGRPFIGKSPELKSAEARMELAMRSRKNELAISTIRSDVSMCCIFYFDYHSFWLKSGTARKKTLPDLSNLYQLVEDCLESSGVLENDRLIQSHDGSRILPAPRNKIYLELSMMDPPERYV